VTVIRCWIDAGIAPGPGTGTAIQTTPIADSGIVVVGGVVGAGNEVASVRVDPNRLAIGFSAPVARTSTPVTVTGIGNPLSSSSS